MPYQQYRLRDADVWAKVDETGTLVPDGEGRVEIVYKPVSGAKTYRASARNLSAPIGPPIDFSPLPKHDLTPRTTEVAAPRDGREAKRPGRSPDAAIHVWTDGGAAPNPGPSGVGIVIVDGDRTTELAEFLGHGTNQIAELTAILIGLSTLRTRDRPVIVYSDSAYAIGLLSQAWKAKANVELVATLRAVCREFRDLRFVKVAGHSGIQLNERTDALVGEAIRSGRSAKR